MNNDPNTLPPTDEVAELEALCDPLTAIAWMMHGCPLGEVHAFLIDWSAGDFAEWFDYRRFVKENPPVPRTPARPAPTDVSQEDARRSGAKLNAWIGRTIAHPPAPTDVEAIAKIVDPFAFGPASTKPLGSLDRRSADDRRAIAIEKAHEIAALRAPAVPREVEEEAQPKPGDEVMLRAVVKAPLNKHDGQYLFHWKGRPQATFFGEPQDIVSRSAALRASPAPAAPVSQDSWRTESPEADAAGIAWFEARFGLPLGDMPGRLDVERVRASAARAAEGGVLVVQRLEALERNSHPPIDLGPAIEEYLASRAGGELPADVVRLVIAARGVAYEDHPARPALLELDLAAEAFASRVGWENEPGAEAPDSHCPAADDAGDLAAIIANAGGPYALADFLKEVSEVVFDAAYPNYADWSIMLPAGHWRALYGGLKALASQPSEATHDGEEKTHG